MQPPVWVQTLAQIATCCIYKKVGIAASKCHLHAAAKALELRRAEAAFAMASGEPSGAKDAL